MELGEKLRQARLEAGMTQRQLCGQEITRNMLSQIENGTARPSMATLQYLARQLDKPVSWFLEEDGAVSANLQIIEEARESYRQGKAEQCLLRLQTYREPDSLLDQEYRLLRLLTLLTLTEQATQMGKKPYALELLAEADALADRCLYDVAGLKRQRILLRLRLQPERVGELVRELPNLDEELLHRAEASRAAGDLSRAEALLGSMEQRNTPQWAVAMAETYFARKEYASAAKWYAVAEEVLPEQTLPRLEQCFQALEDYKLAYYYACKQRKNTP